MAGAHDFEYMSDVTVSLNSCGPVTEHLREWCGHVRNEEYEYKAAHSTNRAKVKEICKVQSFKTIRPGAIDPNVCATEQARCGLATPRVHLQPFLYVQFGSWGRWWSR